MLRKNIIKKNNICYANSIIQSLYYCEAFRKQILLFQPKINEENPISILQEVFHQILNYKKKVGVISTKKLMNFAKRKNGEKNFF